MEVSSVGVVNIIWKNRTPIGDGNYGYRPCGRFGHEFGKIEPRQGTETCFLLSSLRLKLSDLEKQNPDRGRKPFGSSTFGSFALFGKIEPRQGTETIHIHTLIKFQTYLEKQNPDRGRKLCSVFSHNLPPFLFGKIEPRQGTETSRRYGRNRNG